MLHRPAIVGISLIFLLASSLHAADGFPKTAEDYATVYEIQLYRQFQGNSAEYRRRIQASKQVIKRMKKAKSPEKEAVAINWFRSASQSGVLAPVPAFGASDASGAKESTITRRSNTPTDRSFATTDAVPERAPDSSEPAKPEYDWEKNTPAMKAADAGNAMDEAMAAEDPWSADQIDAVFGGDDTDSHDSLSEAIESLVTADSDSQSVIKKGSQSMTSTSASDTDLTDDLSQVWDDSVETDNTADQLAAVSPMQDAPVEDLPTYSSPPSSAADQETASASVSDDWSAPTGDMAEKADGSWGSSGVSIKEYGASQGLGAVPGMSGLAPMAMMGGGSICGIGSLICWVMTMITAFKKKPVFGLLSLITCGLAGLIIGWIKHKEWGITRTMKIWTGCIVLGMACNMAAGFLAAMGS